MRSNGVWNSTRQVVFTFLVAGMLTGCGGGNLIGPTNQLEVGTAVDNFQFQVSNLDNVSQGLSYTWENTGDQATVDISQAITAGSVILTIRDADGTVVHEEDIRQDNDTDTAVGVAGRWTIEFQLDEVTGTFNVIAQRKT